MTVIIYALVKLFDKLEHAESFMKGNLRMSTLRKYKNYRDLNGELRGDPYEGVVSILQPSKIGMVKIGNTEILGTNLASPIVVHCENLLDKYAFCIYSLNSSGFDVISRETLFEFKKILEMHHSCFGLGRYCVVITNANSFISKCRDAIQSLNIEGGLGLVDYYDDSTVHGDFNVDRYGFQKRNIFSHQREYRVLIENDNRSEEYYYLNIGNISNISQLSTTEEFNEKLCINLPPDV